MLTVPRIGGAAQLRLFVEELGFAQACKAVAVHPTTMRRWLRGDPEPPQAPLQALYWLTSWGFSDACSQAHWSHQVLVGRLRALQAREAFRAPGHWAAANEADYHAPGLVVPLQLA